MTNKEQKAKWKKYRLTQYAKPEWKEYYKNKARRWREENPERFQDLIKRRKENKPWSNNYYAARARCIDIERDGYKNYGGRGIKFLLSQKDMQLLWFRDKAFLMHKPSIDREDNDGNYEFSNCRFIEMKEHNKKSIIDRKRKKGLLRVS